MVEAPAPLVVQLHHRADELLRDDDRRADVRLLDDLELARHLGRVVHLHPLADARLDAVGDVRRGDEQVEVELALEPLAHDLHVQQAEEAAAEAEAERLRRLGLVDERARRSASAARARRAGPGYASESVGKSPANTIGLTSL